MSTPAFDVSLFKDDELVMRTISAMKAKKHFGAVLQQVSRTGEPLKTTRAGRLVAVILSPAAHEAECRHATLLEEQKKLARVAFGRWAGRDDITDDWLQDGRR